MTDFEAHNRYQRAYYERSDKVRMRPSFSPYTDRQISRMIRFARLATGHRILEVGCGQGRYTLPLLDRGFDVTGLDLSPVLLDRIRAARPQRSEWPLVACDVADVRRSVEGSFDRVIGFFSLHHMHDYGVVFRALADVMAPGARIAFLEPNPFNALYYLQILLTPGMTWRGDRGIVNMRRSVVFRALAAGGFEELRLERFGFFPPFIANRPGAGAMEAALEGVPGLGHVLPFQLFGGTLAR